MILIKELEKNKVYWKAIQWKRWYFKR